MEQVYVPCVPSRELNVGGVEVRFRCERRDLLEQLGVRWAPCPPVGREPDLVIDYQVGPRVDRGRPAFEVTKIGPHVVRLSRDDLEGEVEAGRPARGRFTGAPGLGDLAVLQALGMAVPSMGGVLMHAAGVADERGALLFNGKSGAGKTTIAGLLTGVYPVALGDENISVLPSSRHDAWTAHSIPLLRPGVTSQHAPLRAILLLRQGPANRVRRASRLSAFAEILPNTRTWQPERAMTVVEELLETIPCHELEFSRGEPAVLFELLKTIG